MLALIGGEDGLHGAPRPLKQVQDQVGGVLNDIEHRHRRFAALGKKDREALNKAAALIRMADALDYRHMEAVRDVAIDLQPGKVVLTLSGAQDCAPEQDRLLVKGDLFMHIFGVELECVCPIL